MLECVYASGERTTEQRARSAPSVRGSRTVAGREALSFVFGAAATLSDLDPVAQAVRDSNRGPTPSGCYTARMARAKLLVVLLCVSTASGCSNPVKNGDAGDSGASPDALVSSPVGVFFTELVKAECKLQTRCGSYPDATVCDRHLLYDKHAIQGMLDAEYAVSKGRTIFHPEATAACLDAYASLTCSSTAIAKHDPSVPCALVFVGTLAEGATCLSDTECPSGECNLVPCMTSGSCCMSQCTGQSVRQPVGAACDWACVAEAYCDRSTAPATCRPRLAAGQTCQSIGDCLPGLACVPDSAPRTCMAFVPDGQACSSGGATCDNPRSFCDVVSGTCVPRGMPGDICSGAKPCVSFAICVAGVCQSLPIEGDSCVSDAGTTGRCLSGTCIDGRCAVAPAPEQPCAFSVDAGV